MGDNATSRLHEMRYLDNLEVPIFDQESIELLSQLIIKHFEAIFKQQL